MKSIAFIPLSVLALAAGLGISTVQAEEGQLPGKDYKFVLSALAGGKLEVTLGKLASQNSSDPAVRDFGTQMVKDHGAANIELVQLLGQKNASRTDTSEKEQRIVKHLQGLTGGEFDRAYIEQMVSDHETVIKEFQAEANSGDDADVKSFAAKTLPTLQEHLRMAQDIKSKITIVASK